jgi:F-type H+-transporting ATPase subunit gamma
LSGTTQALEHQIAGANDLQSVVRSMKALAASSIGQYEKAVLSLEDYYRTVKLGLIACLRDEQRPASLVVEGKSSSRENVGAIIFGSDQGLVGNFNEVVVDSLSTTVKTLPGKVVQLWAVGERVQGILQQAGSATVDVLPVPASIEGITPLVTQILIAVETARERGEIWEIYLFHNRPRSGSLYEPVCKRLLPLDKAWEASLLSMSWPTRVLPEVIEGTASALPVFIRGYLFVVLFQACAESLASENASRLAAMQRAEKNIEDILGQMNQTLHRIRQETIDEELFDVISGFEALNGSRTHF